MIALVRRIHRDDDVRVTAIGNPFLLLEEALPESRDTRRVGVGLGTIGVLMATPATVKLSSGIGVSLTMSARSPSFVVEHRLGNAISRSDAHSRGSAGECRNAGSSLRAFRPLASNPI